MQAQPVPLDCEGKPVGPALLVVNWGPVLTRPANYANAGAVIWPVVNVADRGNVVSLSLVANEGDETAGGGAVFLKSELKHVVPWVCENVNDWVRTVAA